MDLHNFIFYSTSHYRFEKGVKVSGGAAKRAIKIEDSISGNKGYSVTIFDLELSSTLRYDKVSMSTKPMEVISSSPSETKMRGWGIYTVPLVGIQIPFSNYGLTILHPDGHVKEIILHLYDRNIMIVYKA